MCINGKIVIQDYSGGGTGSSGSVQEVEEDAASLFSEITRFTGSTIPGIGATSGKAIKSVGEFLINRVGDIRMYNRLRVIRAGIRSSVSTIPSSYFSDILELQRYVIGFISYVVDCRLFSQSRRWCSCFCSKDCMGANPSFFGNKRSRAYNIRPTGMVNDRGRQMRGPFISETTCRSEVIWLVSQLDSVLLTTVFTRGVPQGRVTLRICLRSQDISHPSKYDNPSWSILTF